MENQTVHQLLGINRQFYQTFAGHFSATRQRLQPGVCRILSTLDPQANLLDLGCGNGELWQELQRRQHAGQYIGLDFSPGLLSQATGLNGSAQAVFIEADLASPDWPERLPLCLPDIILAFASLHHLPGLALRQQVLSSVHRLLAQTAAARPAKHKYFILSVWQVESWPKFSQRILPWESVGLSPELLEPGDYLLDWRHGGRGLRYVHHFTPAELADLASACGFLIQDSYLSDGKNGALGLYQVWELV